MIPGLIHKAYLAKRDGTDFNIWGSGAPLRQFIFNKVVILVILDFVGGGVVNVVIVLGCRRWSRMLPVKDEQLKTKKRKL